MKLFKIKEEKKVNEVGFLVKVKGNIEPMLQYVRTIMRDVRRKIALFSGFSFLRLCYSLCSEGRFYIFYSLGTVYVLFLDMSWTFASLVGFISVSNVFFVQGFLFPPKDMWRICKLAVTTNVGRFTLRQKFFVRKKTTAISRNF